MDTALQLPTMALPPMIREYIDIRGGVAQLFSFIALAAGIKPVLDDWIDVQHLDRFARLVEGLGLVYSVGSYFEFIDEPDPAPTVIGSERLNTTRARGFAPDACRNRGAAHIFIARDREALACAMASGWYTLVIDDRVVEKPWIDHYHFGEYLGYPRCCRQFFARHNDWNSDNTLYQASRRSGRQSYLCNTLLKHAGLSYAVHLPCSFSCDATMQLASRVRAAVAEISPALVAYADRLLQMPYLILSEWDAFGFLGQLIEPNRIEYQDVVLTPSNRPNHRLYQALCSGTSIVVDQDIVKVYADGIVIEVYRARSDRFGPEIPTLVNFGI